MSLSMSRAKVWSFVAVTCPSDHSIAMTPELTAKLKREYNTRQEAADEALANAMLWAYREMTGKMPSDRFSEKIMDAVKFDQ